ncbi:MAG TPA: DNA repair protein RecO [Spirochaetota bacterium]|nr:DNA repair protein RecO [Spirochaetota bacterium]
MSEGKYTVTEGYILKTSPAGDFARNFTFISPIIGVNGCIAFGAERLKSRFCSTVQPFVKAKLFLSRGQNSSNLRIEDISDIETNDFLRQDIRFLQLCYFFVDILLNSYVEKNEFKSFFYLLSYSVEILKTERDVKKSFLFFVSKYLFLSGYLFNLKSCSKCSCKSEKYYFDIREGGVFCENCSKSKKNLISSENCLIFKTFYDKKFVELKGFSFPDKNLDDLWKVIFLILKDIFEKNLKTFDLIEEMLLSRR